MNDQERSRPRLNLGGIRRAVNLTPQSLVHLGEVIPGQQLPLLVTPIVEGVSLPKWIAENRDFLETKLLRHGGILFRGFGLKTMQDFQSIIKAFELNLLEYRERSSPRTEVGPDIYSSTDHPADQPIFLHNENSYAQNWPNKILFFAQQPAESDGETPLADVRQVYQQIAPEIRDRFEQLGVKYVRNFSPGIGLSWQTVFQTSDREAAEVYARQAGYRFEWKAADGLRASRLGAAVLKHPRTGEKLWFNHAAFFHVTTLPEHVKNTLLAQFDEHDLPNNTYYGDGTPIETEVAAHLRAVFEANTVTFHWQQGDLLLLDNMLVAHGRRPYTGQRKILVAMAEPQQAQPPGQ